MSSPTITPPDILCCGPLGSTRYYKLTIVGVAGTCPECNLNCDCDGINGDYYVDVLDGSLTGHCAAQLTLTEICGYALLSFLITACTPNRVTYRIHLAGTGGTTPALNIDWKLEEIESAMDVQVVPFLSQLGGECDPSASCVIVTPISPAEIKALHDECFPRRNTPDTRVNSPLIMPDPVSQLNTTCGTCDSAGGALTQIPGNHQGTSGACTSNACSVVYNIENGNIQTRLSVPVGGLWDPGASFIVNTTHSILGGSVFGKRVNSIYNQKIVSGNSLMMDSVGVLKCDGSVEVHTCKASGPGVYVPPPDSTNVLTLNADGTHTEKTGDGHTFDYAASDGSLFRITNPNGGVWTLVGGATPQYVVDPASRRSTFLYDSGTGRFRGFQDSYSRRTTVTLDSGNRLTSLITPELCTTELRYDSDDRLTAVISPAGLRTSMTYTTDGLCSQIKMPDGGTYQYTYVDWLNTTVTAPDSSVTTVRHYVSRQVKSIQGPVGGRSSFTYVARRLMSRIEPSGERVTMSYVTLPNGAKGLAGTTKSDGRSTFVYDINSRVQATIDASGARTTFVRNTAGLVTAQINAANFRTSFVYNSNGQGMATIDPLGSRSTTVYDSVGNVVAQINPLSKRTTFSYVNGQKTTAKSPVGAVSTSIYDLNNRVLGRIDPLGARTSFVYESCTAPVATIRPDGSRTSSIYRFGRVEATINPLGQRTSFAYDVAGRRIRSQSPMGRISTTVYDAAGRPAATISPTGLRSTTVYDNAGRAVASVDPAGLRSTTVYDTCCNKPKATIAPTGARTSFSYNKLGSQIRTTGPTGAISTTVYDVLNRTVASIDPLGKRATTIYDAANRTIANVNALNQRSTTVYNAASQAIGSINALGFRTTQVYDAAGRGIASINSKGNRWTTVHDLAGRSIASVDPLNRRTTSVYNKNSAVVASINAAGNRSTTVYDLAGQTIAHIDAKGARSTTTYNADGQTVASINALGFRTTSIYDAGGRGVASVAANGGRSTMAYDNAGRAAASVNPLGKRWTTIYNSVGQTVGSKDPLGNRSTSVFDSAGRVMAAINPLGFRTTTVYNIASQNLATVDANGNRVSSVYDALGRRNVEINALGYRTTTIFDAVGQTSALVDARGNRHSFTYDSTGAQTQLIDPLNRRTTRAYDIAGQQTLRIDARSNRTTYAYSSLSQLTSRKYPDGSRATFSYDEVGNRSLMADSTGRYTSVYDTLGQTMVTASPNNQRNTYSYDGIGTRRSLDASGAGRFTYAYDLAGQVISLRNPYGERTTFSYDEAGRRTVQRNANGTRVSTVYDAASQTTQVIHRTSGGTSLLQLDYRYDNAGNRNVLIEGGGTARTTWSYDPQNQLTGEFRTGTNAYRQTFTFDPAGNRTLKNIDGARTTYAYDSANQLRYGQAVAGRTTYQYDLTGNQQIEQPPVGNRTTTTWNYENQPTQYLLSAGAPVTMAYNGDNRRVLKQQGTDITKFVWDSVIDAYVKELDGSSVVQAVYTNEPQQYGGVLSQRRGSTTSILHADALGTTRLLTDNTQTVTDMYLYDAWGNLIASGGTTVMPFRWVGRYGYYMDENTEMVYVRARMYMPTVARWASVDPLLLLSEVESPPDAVYSLNAPILLLDPAGLIAVDRVPEFDVLGNRLGCKSPPAQAAWIFKSSLPTGWPCDGKLIQLVKIVCQVSPYCRDEHVRLSRRAYVEGWDVTKGKHVVDVNENGFPFTDMAIWGPPRMNSWGNYTQTTSIRLFCYPENRDGSKNAPNVSRVALRQLLKAPVTALARDPFCETRSGILPGRTIGWEFVPKWWENLEAREGIGHRTFGVYWDCCCEPFDHEASASEVGMV